MSKLTGGERAAIPSGEFALAGRRYPVEDRSHAANAKARAGQQETAGNLSPAEKAEIDAKADRVLRGPKRSASSKRSERIGRK